MRPMRPRLRVNSDASINLSPSSFSPASARPSSMFKQEAEVARPLYPHTSTFRFVVPEASRIHTLTRHRSTAMDVSVNSASVKMARSTSHAHPLPIYGDHDSVNGTVRLTSHIKPSSGRMSVSVRRSCLHTSCILDAAPAVRRGICVYVSLSQACAGLYIETVAFAAPARILLGNGTVVAYDRRSWPSDEHR
jgi:hypothetical protein